MEENKKELVNIRDLMAEYENDYTDDFVLYDGYIDDAISELADSNISIYNHDLLEWVAEGTNEMYVEDAINELGQADTFFGMIQQGQYLYHSEKIREDIENILIYTALYYLEDIKGEEVESDLVDLVIDNITEYSYGSCFDRFDEILETVKNTIEEYESEE